MVDQLCICMRLIAVWRPRARTLGRVRPSVALFSPQVQSHTLRVECRVHRQMTVWVPSSATCRSGRHARRR